MTTERLYIEQHRLKYSINQPMEKTKKKTFLYNLRPKSHQELTFFIHR